MVLARVTAGEEGVYCTFPFEHQKESSVQFAFQRLDVVAFIRLGDPWGGLPSGSRRVLSLSGFRFLKFFRQFLVVLSHHLLLPLIVVFLIAWVVRGHHLHFS
jgi:hypothetical protein